MDTITNSMIEAGRAAYRARMAGRIAERARRNAKHAGRGSGLAWEAQAAAACRARSIKAARRAAHQLQRLQGGW